MREPDRRMGKTVRAELVEALRFLCDAGKGRGFDKLSPNGWGVTAR
jgi:hypothetical protein